MSASRVGMATRCAACGSRTRESRSGTVPLTRPLPEALRAKADRSWWEKTGGGPRVDTGVLCNRCVGKVAYAARKERRTEAAKRPADGTRRRSSKKQPSPERKLVAPPQPLTKVRRLSPDSEVRFNEVAPVPRRPPNEGLPPFWRTADEDAAASVQRPTDGRLRSAMWRRVLVFDWQSSVNSRAQPVALLDVVRGMRHGEPGPPLLLGVACPSLTGAYRPKKRDDELTVADADSRVEALIFDDDGDGLLDARRRLLAVSDRKVLHEVRVDGHALDQLDGHGLKLHDERQLDIDEHATRHRFALFDSFCAGGVPQHERLFQRFGWADPDKFVPCPSLSGPQPSLRRPLRLSLSPSLLGTPVSWMDHRRSSCRLLEHPSEVPLLVAQHHGEQQELAAGASMAPVLMYAPALHRLLRPGHPGRAALEQLLPPEGGTWLNCVLPLPPDHRMCGWTLDQANSAGVA